MRQQEPVLLSDFVDYHNFIYTAPQMRCGVQSMDFTLPYLERQKVVIAEWYLENTPWHVEYLDHEIFCDPNDAEMLKLILSAYPASDSALTLHTWASLSFSMYIEALDFGRKAKQKLKECVKEAAEAVVQKVFDNMQAQERATPHYLKHNTRSFAGGRKSRCIGR